MELPIDIPQCEKVLLQTDRDDRVVIAGLEVDHPGGAAAVQLHDAGHGARTVSLATKGNLGWTGVRPVLLLELLLDLHLPPTFLFLPVLPPPTLSPMMLMQKTSL